jgi:TonB family protein
MKNIGTLILTILSFTVAAQTTSGQNKSVDTTAHISYEMKYPAEARKNGIQGTVKVKVTFDHECNIIKREITKSLGYGCDEEALVVLKNMEGKIKEERTKCEDGEEVTLPFHFRLD